MNALSRDPAHIWNSRIDDLLTDAAWRSLELIDFPEPGPAHLVAVEVVSDGALWSLRWEEITLDLPPLALLTPAGNGARPQS